MSDAPVYPPLPGSGSWSFDEASKAWKPVTPDDANAALDEAAGIGAPAKAKTSKAAMAPAPTGDKT